MVEKISFKNYQQYLKPRKSDWHKGLSGHVLIVGGDLGFLGAPCMAGMAALRVGAGLVTIATRLEHAAIISCHCPALMCHGISTPEELNPLFEKATIVIIGPGLNLKEWGKSLWAAVSRLSLPILVDADGLNWLAMSPMKKNNWILTPHPAEAARLLQTTPQKIQEDRLQAIQNIQAAYGGTVVLKGAGSLVMGENDLPVLCERGNPGMATAGMGDVLSGVIAGLFAQGMPLKESAILGVECHARAGDLAAKMGGERGLIATDLMPYLRSVVNLGEKQHD
jgi:hydroxyethylthiazole kinase-like uncharacterized protein yjeF